MRRAFLLVIITFLLNSQNHTIAQTTPQPDSQGTPVTITQLGPARTGPRTSYSSGSCLFETERLVIRDQEAWDKLWSRMGRGPGCGSFTLDDPSQSLRSAKPTIIPAPDVDFSNEMIIVAAMGIRPTTSYAIVIDRVYERGDKLAVVVRSISPGYGCAQFPASSRPVDIVRLARSERLIVFREIQAEMECKNGAPFTIRDKP